jgi:hypothetical protein
MDETRCIHYRRGHKLGVRRHPLLGARGAVLSALATSRPPRPVCRCRVVVVRESPIVLGLAGTNSRAATEVSPRRKTGPEVPRTPVPRIQRQDALSGAAVSLRVRRGQ